MKRKHPTLSRRTAVRGAVAACLSGLVPISVWGSPEDADLAIAEHFGADKPVSNGRVTVKLPPISENGYSVPLEVLVKSPMNDTERVVQVAVFAEENPLAKIASYNFGKHSGPVHIQTRIRMGGSQRIRAVAELNDGSLWSGYAFSVVTLAACVL